MEAGSRCNGKYGEDIYIGVPRGTVVKDAETGKVVVDLSEPNQVELVLKGGHRRKGKFTFCNTYKTSSKICTRW